MSESTRMLLGLALGIIVMIVLVMKTKVHSFMALLISQESSAECRSQILPSLTAQLRLV